jgi:hypothetical protein
MIVPVMRREIHRKRRYNSAAITEDCCSVVGYVSRYRKRPLTSLSLPAQQGKSYETIYLYRDTQAHVMWFAFRLSWQKVIILIYAAVHLR